jgi:hypothetical protein
MLPDASAIPLDEAVSIACDVAMGQSFSVPDEHLREFVKGLGRMAGEWKILSREELDQAVDMLASVFDSAVAQISVTEQACHVLTSLNIRRYFV